MVYLGGHSSVFQVPFEKFLELTQEVLEKVRAFKFSSLKQKRDQLDTLFGLPDAEKEWSRTIQSSELIRELWLSLKKKNLAYFSPLSKEEGLIKLPK